MDAGLASQADTGYSEVDLRIEGSTDLLTALSSSFLSLPVFLGIL